MWDTVQVNSEHLSHDLPCWYCGHAAHRYLPCDRECGCEPVPVDAGLAHAHA